MRAITTRGVVAVLAGTVVLVVIVYVALIVVANNGVDIVLPH